VAAATEEVVAWEVAAWGVAGAPVRGQDLVLTELAVQVVTSEPRLS
jgi:hypothetical protein